MGRQGGVCPGSRVMRWSMSHFGGSPRGSSSGKMSANSVSRGAMRGSLSLTKRLPEGESSARNISLSSWGARDSSSAREITLTLVGVVTISWGFVGVVGVLWGFDGVRVVWEEVEVFRGSVAGVVLKVIV